MTLNNRAAECCAISKSKGFQMKEAPVKQLLLIASEVQEAIENVVVSECDPTLNMIKSHFDTTMFWLEEARKKGDLKEVSTIKKENNLSEELVDILIRVFSFAGDMGIDLDEEYSIKTQKNKNRPILHGKHF